MATPRVSIIIPIYKTEKYLHDCLLSVQRQSMPDYQAILVNDCTPDNSMQIASEYAKSDSRFHIVEHKENKGLGCARNTGLLKAQGEYINFLDSDDRLPIDALQIMLELVDTYHADMVVGNMAWSNNHYLSAVKYINQRIQLWSAYFDINLRNMPLEASFIGSVCNRLIKKQLIQEKSIVFPKNVYYEDIPYTLMVWFFSTNIIATKRYVYFRTCRQEKDNLSLTQIFNKKAYSDRDKIAQFIYDFVCKNTSASKLGIITLNNMLITATSMLDLADEAIKKYIKNNWFPQHKKRINNMIAELSKMNSIFLLFLLFNSSLKDLFDVM